MSEIVKCRKCKRYPVLSIQKPMVDKMVDKTYMLECVHCKVLCKEDVDMSIAIDDWNEQNSNLLDATKISDISVNAVQQIVRELIPYDKAVSHQHFVLIVEKIYDELMRYVDKTK